MHEEAVGISPDARANAFGPGCNSAHYIFTTVSTIEYVSPNPVNLHWAAPPLQQGVAGLVHGKDSQPSQKVIQGALVDLNGDGRITASLLAEVSR